MYITLCSQVHPVVLVCLPHLTSFPITFDNGDFTTGSLSYLLSNRIYAYEKKNKYGNRDLQICQTEQLQQLTAHVSILS